MCVSYHAPDEQDPYITLREEGDEDEIEDFRWVLFLAAESEMHASTQYVWCNQYTVRRLCTTNTTSVKQNYE